MSMKLDAFLEEQAKEFSTQQLLTMLALHGVWQAKDMMSDMIGDDAMEFLGGALPNENDLINHAHIMATEVTVQLGLDEMIDDNTFNQANLPKGQEVTLGTFMRLAIQQLLKDNAKLSELTIRLR